MDSWQSEILLLTNFFCPSSKGWTTSVWKRERRVVSILSTIGHFLELKNKTLPKYCVSGRYSFRKSKEVRAAIWNIRYRIEVKASNNRWPLWTNVQTDHRKRSFPSDFQFHLAFALQCFAPSLNLFHAGCKGNWSASQSLLCTPQSLIYKPMFPEMSMATMIHSIDLAHRITYIHPQGSRYCYVTVTPTCTLLTFSHNMPVCWFDAHNEYCTPPCFLLSFYPNFLYSSCLKSSCHVNPNMPLQDYWPRCPYSGCSSKRCRRNGKQAWISQGFHYSHLVCSYQFCLLGPEQKPQVSYVQVTMKEQRFPQIWSLWGMWWSSVVLDLSSEGGECVQGWKEILARFQNWPHGLNL